MNTKNIAYFHDDRSKNSRKNSFHLSMMQNTVEASFSLGKASDYIKLNSDTITDDNVSLIDDESRVQNKTNFLSTKDFCIVNYSDNLNIIPSEMECFNISSNKSSKSLFAESAHRTDTKHQIKFNNGRWSTEEHQKFIEAMFLYGNEWKKVQQHIKTRSSTQARSHAQKFFIRLRRIFLNEEEDNHKNMSADIQACKKRNEKILNWIKESLNLDVIVKLLQSSGNESSEENLNNLNLFNGDHELFNDIMSCCSGYQYLGNSPKMSEYESYEIRNFNSYANPAINVKKKINNKNNLMEQLNSSVFDRQISKEAFISERKEILCKIILDLISNPSRIKKNTMKSQNNNVAKKDNINSNFNNNNLQIAEISAKYSQNKQKISNEIMCSYLTSDYPEYKINNNINLNTGNATFQSNIESINSSNYIYHEKSYGNSGETMPKNERLINNNESDIFIKTECRDNNQSYEVYNMNNNNNATSNDSNMYNSKSRDYSDTFFQSDRNRKTLNQLQSFKQSNQYLKYNQAYHYNHLDQSNLNNNSSVNPATTNNHYLNPNMNNYINIVTINLGCDEKSSKGKETSTANLTNNEKNNYNSPSKNFYEFYEENSVNKINSNINNNVNLNDNNINLADESVRDLQSDSENFKKILSRKLLMIEYQKFIKNKFKRNQTQTHQNQFLNPNVISNTNHLNITNGECNIINHNNFEQDKEPNLMNDPFRISFHDSYSAFSNNPYVMEENDINKLNLDLDHFFNMDNL